MINFHRRFYENPVFRGDYPDPSVIRVGENEFWATTTSTEWAPQFPLLHSRDLVNWRPVGAVFPERPDWAKGKFWAPEISQYNGVFYVYYVAQHVDGPLTIGVATAPEPRGPYTDHGPLVGQTSGSIDPTPVTGEDGRRYLIWKEDGNSRGLPTTIWIQPLTADGLKLTGEARAILKNDTPWEGHVVEAPSVIRRGEYFYLFYSGNSCCGRNCKYAVGVARARSVMGPWEKYAGNPILKSNTDWRCPGHGSIVDTAGGRTYYLYHAYDKRDSIFVGRQTLVDEVTWGPSGWPSINAGHGPSSRAPLPIFRKRAAVRAILSPGAAGTWQWPQSSPPRVRFGRGLRKGGVVLGSAEKATPGDTLAAVLARPPHYGDYTAETAIDVRSVEPGVEVGLCAYGDAKNAVGVALRDGTLRVWQRTAGKHRILHETPCTARGTLRLRMIARRGYYFSFEVNTNGAWAPLRTAPLRAAHLPPWDRGVRVALTAGGRPAAHAEFRYLRIRKSEPQRIRVFQPRSLVRYRPVTSPA